MFKSNVKPKQTDILIIYGKDPNFKQFPVVLHVFYGSSASLLCMCSCFYLQNICTLVMLLSHPLHKSTLFIGNDGFVLDPPEKNTVPPVVKETTTPSAQRVNCMVTQWSEWTACPVTCGRGYQHRRRMIKRHPENGGKKCPKKLQKKKKCKRQKCPRLKHKSKKHGES